MVIDLSNRKSNPHVWCRFCGARAWLEESTNVPQESLQRIQREVEEPRLPENLVRRLVSDLGARRRFFHERGLSDDTIERYQLGYHVVYHRYAIPCYYNDRLYGVKYRIEPVAEQQMKARGEKYAKYISEKGGVNNVVFNDFVAKTDTPYLLIDEGELDAMLLTQHGFPTISPFSGNNSRVGWRPEWRRLIAHIPNIYVIAQNDDAGELIAIARLHDLGRGKAVRAPQGYKDLGEWLRSMPADQRQRELVNLLHLIPRENPYGNDRHATQP